MGESPRRKEAREELVWYSVKFRGKRDRRKADDQATVKTKRDVEAQLVLGWPETSTWPESSLEVCNQTVYRYRRTISFFPSTPSSKTEPNPRGPGSALEQENREDHTERQTEGGLDDDGGDGAIPLNIQSWRLAGNSYLRIKQRLSLQKSQSRSYIAVSFT